MNYADLPAYHFGLLRGYLSGRDAPAEILEAAEALYKAAAQGQLANLATEASEYDRPAESEKSAEDKVAAFIAQRGVTVVDEKPKRKRNFSPEVREAAAQRMRDMWARKRAEGRKTLNDRSFESGGDDSGNGEAPVQAGAEESGKKYDPTTGLEVCPKTGALILF